MMILPLIRQQRFDEAEKDMKRKRREVGQAKKRIAELDRIFKRTYEDDVNGTISHERFLKLSAEYEAEQRELTEKVNAEQKKSIPTNRIRVILTASPPLSASM